MLEIQLEPKIETADVVYSGILSALKTRTPFVYSNIDREFWEQVFNNETPGGSYPETDQVLAGQIDKSPKRRSPNFVEGGFVSEVLEALQNMPRHNPNFIFSAGLVAWPKSDVLQGVPIEPTDVWEGKIKQHVPGGVLHPLADGIEFKRATLNGRFKEFTDLIASESFILVGNRHVKLFPQFIGAKKVTFLEIHEPDARGERYDILEKLDELLEKRSGPQRILFQAGGGLTTWLISNIYNKHPRNTLIDLGIASDICNPIFFQNLTFGKAYRNRLMRTLELVHPGWFEKSLAIVNRDSVVDMAALHEFQTGQTFTISQIVEKADIPNDKRVFDPAVPILRPVAFIENKISNFDRMKSYLSLSVAKNHHANSGPVSRLLEQSIEALLELPPHRKVIMCSSCTAGLHIAAGVHAANAKKPLSWVASAFGFMSSNIGVLADADLIDCNANGHLDVDDLKARPNDSYDGILYTNSFALNLKAWSTIRAHSVKSGKKLIIDNALGLLDRPKSTKPIGEIEVVSCHQTKPWGSGEGGFIIVDKADERLTRSLINFGTQELTQNFRYATNAKISDLACAAILDRLERMAHWAFYYENQAMRLRRIIESQFPELSELPFSMDRKSPVSNLQFLAKHPIKMSDLTNDHFVLRKYYRPLRNVHSDTKAGNNNQFPNASRLFQRMINIPCHSFMREVSNEDIASVLKQVLKKSNN